MIPLDLPPSETLDASLSQYVEQQCHATKVEVNWLGIDPSLLPEGQWQWQGNACRNRPNLFLAVVANHQVQQRIMVQPSLTIWVDVPVAKADTPPGQLVHTTPGQVKLNELIGDPVKVAWQARVFVAKGDPVTTAVVSPIPDATNGTEIKILVQVRSLVISAEGRLMEDASVGDHVRVRNNVTGQVVTGTLKNANTVVIR